ncbi:hypothetical protein D3C71_776110 [compost metagenome]
MTVRFMTTDPVRALMMTLATVGARVTCRSSTCDRKRACEASSIGVRTCTTRPSSAVAVPWPNLRFNAVATFWAVPKSVLFSSTWI